jgi:membrane-bound metal-dependent hydrolase YbcI (DUF457 family)
MNTPSHAILNLALLGRKQQPQWNLPIVLGALIPDAAMFVFYGWTKLVQAMPEPQIWNVAYYLPFWQNLFDVWNSIPLALLGLVIAWGVKQKAVAIGCLSVMLHCLQDLPTHREDAHRHFWPLSNFRFESPISYWDPDHYGAIAALVELALVMLASVYGVRLIRSRWGKGLLIAMNALLLVGYVAFY